MSQSFLTHYITELEKEITKRPGEYAYAVSEAPVVAQKMTEALKRGTGNKNSNAIQRTCRKLKIPFTYAAIQNYLRAEP